MKGSKYLRPDCDAGNRALNEYYERAGFAYRGCVLVRGLEVSLYEKELGISGAGLDDPCCYTFMQCFWIR